MVILALLDPEADPDRRLDGARMLAQLALDIHVIRIGLFKDG